MPAASAFCAISKPPRPLTSRTWRESGTLEVERARMLCQVLTYLAPTESDAFEEHIDFSLASKKGAVPGDRRRPGTKRKIGMKLRIKGNSLRLRVSPSEMCRLMETGRVEETIYFGDQEDEKLTYALEHNSKSTEMTLRYRAQEVTVLIPTTEVEMWKEGDQVGMYGEIGTGHRRMELVVEKDFACLDKGEEENEDTFPNPKQGAVC
jgi:hypothetical protein